MYKGMKLKLIVVSKKYKKIWKKRLGIDTGVICAVVGSEVVIGHIILFRKKLEIVIKYSVYHRQSNFYWIKTFGRTKTLVG